MRWTNLMAIAVLIVTYASLPGMGSEEQERAALKEKAAALIRESQALKEAGKHDQAEEHFKAAQKIIRELRASEGGDRGRAGRGSETDERRAAMAREAEVLRRRVSELRENGKAEEAARAEAELQRLVAQLQQVHAAQERGRAEQERDRRANADERIEHIRQAAQHLRAAGLADLAEEVARRAQPQREREVQREGQRETRREEARRAETRRDEGRPREGQARDGQPDVATMQRQLQELRGQVHEMRQVLERVLAAQEKR